MKRKTLGSLMITTLMSRLLFILWFSRLEKNIVSCSVDGNMVIYLKFDVS